MNPVFHQTLSYWSEARNPDELASRVLGAGESSPVKDEVVAKKVSNVILKFLNENESQLIDLDLKLLRNLQVLVNTLGATYQDRDGTFATLENTVEKTIDLVKGIESVSKSSKPIEEAMNTPNAILSIKEASLPEVSTLLGNMRVMEKIDLLAFETMISHFFRYADDLSQQSFFSHFGRGDEHLLDHVISLLPRNMSHFSAAGCVLLTDEHVKRIVNRLNRLESLDFSHCPHVTNEAVETVANHPNKRNLKDLSFYNCPLVSPEAQAKIEKMFPKK